MDGNEIDEKREMGVKERLKMVQGNVKRERERVKNGQVENGETIGKEHEDRIDTETCSC